MLTIYVLTESGAEYSLEALSNGRIMVKRRGFAQLNFSEFGTCAVEDMEDVAVGENLVINGANFWMESTPVLAIKF